MNPGPGKIKSRDFLGFGMAHKSMFSKACLVFRQLKSLLGTPRTFQSASNVYSVDSGRVLPISVKSFLQHVGLSSCKKVYQDLFLESI